MVLRFPVGLGWVTHVHAFGLQRLATTLVFSPQFFATPLASLRFPRLQSCKAEGPPPMASPDRSIDRPIARPTRGLVEVQDTWVAFDGREFHLTEAPLAVGYEHVLFCFLHIYIYIYGSRSKGPCKEFSIR